MKCVALIRNQIVSVVLIVRHLFPYVIALLLLCPWQVAAQTNLADSLQNRLQVLDEEEEKALVLLELLIEMRGNNAQQALSYGQQALRLSRDLGNDSLEAETYLELGYTHRMLDEFAQASDYYQRSEKLFESAGFQERRAQVLLSLGVVEYFQSRYKEALQYYYGSLDLYETAGDTVGIARALNNIGTTYQMMGKYEDALRYFEQSLELAEYLHHVQGIAFLSNNIGVIYLRKGNYNHAIRNFRLALKMNERIGNPAAIANNLKNIGMIYLKMGVYLKALEYNQEALEIEQRDGLKGAYLGTHNNMGRIYASMGKPEEALGQFELGMKLSEEIGNAEGVKNAAEGLADLYQERGEYDQAYHYYRLFREMQDSIIDIELSEEVSKLRLAYEMERKEKELERLKKNTAESQLALTEREASIQSQRLIIGLASGGGLLLLVLVLLLFNRNQLRKRANEDLQVEVLERKRAEERLQDTNKELNTLMYKSSHDLKSPLASAIGLTNVAQMEVTDPEGLKYIDMIQDRMQYLDSMLSNLISTSRMRQGKIELQVVDFAALLKRILVSINQMHGFDTIQITSELNLSNVFKSDLGILTTVFQNILTNAIKYQDGDKQHRFCHVSVDSIESGVEVRITDNGIGIDQSVKDKAFEMFYRASNTSEGSGLGLYIVMSSVKKIRGTLKLESDKGKGTTIIMRLPVLEQAAPRPTLIE